MMNALSYFLLLAAIPLTVIILTFVWSAIEKSENERERERMKKKISTGLKQIAKHIEDNGYDDPKSVHIVSTLIESKFFAYYDKVIATHKEANRYDVCLLKGDREEHRDVFVFIERNRLSYKLGEHGDIRNYYKED